MPKDDLVYVGHMLETARKILSKVAGTERPAYEEDENLQLALTYLLQVIGEAARRISTDFRAAYPDIPWDKIIGMRHKVVHDYLEVDENIVWDTATTDIPALVQFLEKIVPPEE